MALAAAGFLACAVACCVLAARRHDPFGDLFIYRSAGRAVLGGARLYQLRFAWQLRFTYPPFAALSFVPLAWLPWTVVAALVMAANVAALPMTLWLALRLPPARSWLAGWPRMLPVALSLAVAAGAIWLEPVRTNLAYGQVNLLITVLILADLALPDSSRLKGAAIGIAAGIKLTPAIFAVYLLLTRRYRAAAVSAAAAALTVALGAVLLPGDSAAYWGSGLTSPARIGRVENTANQSLRGALARVLHTVSVQSPWLVAAVVVALAGMALAVLAGRRGDEASGFARCAITGLLISPVSWSHHWVLAVPALLLGCAWAWRTRSAPALTALVAVAAAAWAAIIWQVPNGGSGHPELHLHAVQLVAADAYVLAGLMVLAVAAAGELARIWRGGPAVPGAIPVLAARRSGAPDS